MKIHPMTFTLPMVCALLGGRKTQTRRLFRLPRWANQNATPEIDVHGIWGVPTQNGCWSRLSIPQKGDLIYVREPWRTLVDADDKSPSQLVKGCLDAGYRRPWCVLRYEADRQRVNVGLLQSNEQTRLKWVDVWGRYRQAMHMPRAYTRMTLRVSDVRIEWLHSITNADAKAEGVVLDHCCERCPSDKPWHVPVFPGTCAESPVGAYEKLWDHINPQNPWLLCPLVVATTFQVIEQNVDDYTSANQGE